MEAQGAHVHSIVRESQVDEVLSQRPLFDIALLDLSPVKDRLEEILARLKNLAPNAPVLLMSGEPAGVPAEAQGRFSDWIRKPFDMTQLVTRMTQLLDQ